MQQALKEIAFIVDQRPQQTQAALATAIEVALRDMQRRETMRDIARASQRLSEILPQALMLNDPGSLKLFTFLSEISLEAERYAGPLSWQARRDALDTMLLTLEKIYPNTTFPDPQLNTILADVVAKWHTAIRYQQDKLEQGAESMGQVLNPYNPGNPLKPQDSLFVGRRDVVRQLSESLSKTNRPTFSSIEAFLTRIAEEIYKAVRLRGMSIGRLDYSRLREALQRNEAAIYQPFDAWLDSVESRLERENRTVFLLFDEFEKLEEADKAGYLDLNLDSRSQVEVQDVANAITYVLENWWDTYFRDLWARTNQQQRTCLVHLSQWGASNASILAQHSSLDEQTVHQSLQVLLKRNY